MSDEGNELGKLNNISHAVMNLNHFATVKPISEFSRGVKLFSVSSFPQTDYATLKLFPVHPPDLRMAAGGRPDKEQAGN